MALGRLTALNGMFARWGIQLKSFMGRNPDGAATAALVTWAVLVILSAIPAVRRIVKGQRLKATQLILPLGLVVMLVVEWAGEISLFSVLSDWFLYQGL